MAQPAQPLTLLYILKVFYLFKRLVEVWNWKGWGLTSMLARWWWWWWWWLSNWSLC